MKFAIKKGSKAYEQMEEIFAKMRQANKAAYEMAKEIYEEVSGKQAPEKGVEFTRGRNAAEFICYEGDFKV